MSLTTFAQTTFSTLNQKIQDERVIPVPPTVVSVSEENTVTSAEFGNYFNQGLVAALNEGIQPALNDTDQQASMTLFLSKLPYKNLRSYIRENNLTGGTYVSIQNLIDNASSFQDLKNGLTALSESTSDVAEKNVIFATTTALKLTDSAMLNYTVSQVGLSASRQALCSGWWSCWGKCAAGIIGGAGGGALAGAMGGSAAPVVGTVAGGILGGIFGGLAGASQACD